MHRKDREVEAKMGYYGNVDYNGSFNPSMDSKTLHLTLSVWLHFESLSVPI